MRKLLFLLLLISCKKQAQVVQQQAQQNQQSDSTSVKMFIQWNSKDTCFLTAYYYGRSVNLYGTGYKYVTDTLTVEFKAKKGDSCQAWIRGENSVQGTYYLYEGSLIYSSPINIIPIPGQTIGNYWAKTVKL